MDMKRLNMKQEADEDNYFARIPEDLLLLILSRVDDLKFLCQCSLVSKRFAFIIYHIKTVSLTLPSAEIPSTESVNEIDELFPKISGFTSEEITRFIQSSSLKGLKFLLFLENFRDLKSISLEFMCPNSLCSSSLFNMKVKFSSSGALVERLISLVATSVYKETEQGYDEEEDLGTFDRYSISGTHLTHGCFIEWLIVLSLLVKCQPSLESVIITNSKKQGILVLRDEQLVAWRNNLLPGGFLDNLTLGISSIGWTSKLHLPISGYVMKGVYFVIADIEFPSYFDSSREMEVLPYFDSSRVYDDDDDDDDDADNDDDDDDAMTWEYVGEKKLFDEAMHEISLL